MDALVAGTADGGRIFLNVVALLIAFVALVAMVDSILGAVYDSLSLSRILGVVFAPVTWLLGIGAGEAVAAAEILGTKVAVNEIVAYSMLAESFESLSAETHFILTFALCGFGNLGSLGIIIGGISAMVPERRQEVLGLAPWALLAAFLTNCLTAAIASVLAW